MPYDPTYVGWYGHKIVKRKNDTKLRGIMTRIPSGPFAERLRMRNEEERPVRIRNALSTQNRCLTASCLLYSHHHPDDLTPAHIG